MKKIISCCLCLFFFISATMAQKGDWYTWSTGITPAVHVTISNDEIVLDRTDPATKQGGISGRKSNEMAAEHLQILKKVVKNNRSYLVFQSFDGLYFVTTLQKSPSGDTILMYCADGIEDGYKGLRPWMLSQRIKAPISTLPCSKKKSSMPNGAKVLCQK